jgi:hypothetical protein
MPYSASLSLNDTSTGTRKSASWSVTPATMAGEGGRRTLGLSEIQINDSAIVTGPGELFIANRGATDTIQVGWATGVYEFKLLPGRAILIYPNSPTAQFFAVADGANDADNFEYNILSA